MPRTMKKGKRKGTKRKKDRKPEPVPEKEDDVKAPHSFVIKRGRLTKSVNELMCNFRQILEPFTASNLRVKKTNVTKDFVSVASALSVTHIAMFTLTDKAAFLKLMRLPRGPTVTFRISEFTTGRDVRSSLRRQLLLKTLFQKAPLLVMNGLSGNESMQLKLVSSMWRNMFPAFDINTVVLGDIQRCVLLNYSSEQDCIHLRHYAIRVKPVGLAKGTRKLIATRKLPDLGKYKDIADFIDRDNAAASATESEGEADEKEEFRQVTLCQKVRSRGNLLHEKSAIRLTEIGPRMTLKLFKIEEGLMDGEVLYHSIIQRTKEEARLLSKQKRQKRDEKAKRKAEQEANVQAKRLKAESSRRGILKKTAVQQQEEDGEEEAEDKDQRDDDEIDSDDYEDEDSEDGEWSEGRDQDDDDDDDGEEEAD